MDSIIQNLILFLIALSAIPLGLLISKYTREEIKKGKLEMKLLMAAAAIVFIASFLISFPEQLVAKTIAAFIFLLALTSLVKAKGLKN